MGVLQRADELRCDPNPGMGRNAGRFSASTFDAALDLAQADLHKPPPTVRQRRRVRLTPVVGSVVVTELEYKTTTESNCSAE